MSKRINNVEASLAKRIDGAEAGLGQRIEAVAAEGEAAHASIGQAIRDSEKRIVNTLGQRIDDFKDYTGERIKDLREVTSERVQDLKDTLVATR